MSHEFVTVSGKEAPDPFNMEHLTSLQLMLVLWSFGKFICDAYLPDAGVQELIHSKDKQFDLIIMEAFIHDCFLGFAHKFGAPVVQVCSFGGAVWMDNWVGNPHPYAYVPSAFTTYSDRMTFSERLVNSLHGVFLGIGRKFYYLPQQDAIARKYFNYTDDLPSISQLETSTSLVLLNHHFSLSYPKPLMPNMVQVGGMHIKPAKPLPKVIGGNIWLSHRKLEEIGKIMNVD
jgi:glucuronosyltransferase